MGCQLRDGPGGLRVGERAGWGGFAGVIVGTLYALLDGAIAGAILAWVYNMASRASMDPLPASMDPLPGTA